MKLIIIYGAMAVGKLTTAKELVKKTGYPLLHNHLARDLALNFFEFDSEPYTRLIRRMRLYIVNELLNQKCPGLIWTTGLPNTIGSKNFYKKLEDLIHKAGGEIYYVKLVCEWEEQKRRVVNEERRKHKKLITVEGLGKAMREIDFSTLTPKDRTLKIDNTFLSSQEVASKIIIFFHLDKK